MTGKSPPPASPPLPPRPVGGGLVSDTLEPDINITRKAIERLVDALTGDPGEIAAIISSAGFEAIANMTDPILAIAAFRACIEGGELALRPRLDA